MLLGKILLISSTTQRQDACWESTLFCKKNTDMFYFLSSCCNFTLYSIIFYYHNAGLVLWSGFGKTNHLVRKISRLGSKNLFSSPQTHLSSHQNIIFFVATNKTWNCPELSLKISDSIAPSKSSQWLWLNLKPQSLACHPCHVLLHRRLFHLPTWSCQLINMYCDRYVARFVDMSIWFVAYDTKLNRSVVCRNDNCKHFILLTVFSTNIISWQWRQTREAFHS